MKIIKNICLLISLFIISISYNVKADTFKYYLSTKGLDYAYVNKSNAKEISVKRGDTITVYVVVNYSEGNDSYKINNGKATIRWDDNYLKYTNYSTSNSILASIPTTSVTKTSNKLVFSNLSSKETLKNGKNAIIEVKFKVLDNSNSGSTKIYQMDGEDSLNIVKIADESTTKTESLYTELKYNVQKSTVNKLSAIKLDGKALEYFSEDKNDYDIQVEQSVEKIKIEATKKDSKSVISGDIGEKKLSYGTNKFTITVTSESGAKNTYNINILREDLRSNDNSLKTLTLSSGEIKFKPATTEYTINVENDVDKITIKSSLNDSKAKYVTDYRNKEVELVEGSNKIEIKVISEKGTERVYTLNINRALSSNNSLKSLKVNDEKITLIENEFTYNVTVENEVAEVVIAAITNDAKATVKLDDNYPLEVGENEINIKVVAASGAEATYILNITREKIPSKDSLLTSLKIKDYDLGFNPGKYYYNLKIKDESELEITTTQEDPNATVEIEGNKDLENGSIIKVNVKAEDGSFTRYFITIEKGSKGIPTIVVILIILFLMLGGCVGLIFYRKKKQEEKELNKLDNTNEVNENVEVPIVHENDSVVESQLDEENVDDDNYVGAHEMESEENNEENEKDV